MSPEKQKTLNCKVTTEHACPAKNSKEANKLFILLRRLCFKAKRVTSQDMKVRPLIIPEDPTDVQLLSSARKARWENGSREEGTCTEILKSIKYYHTLFLYTDVYFVKNESNATSHMINCFNQQVTARETVGARAILFWKYQKLRIN